MRADRTEREIVQGRFLGFGEDSSYERWIERAGKVLKLEVKICSLKKNPHILKYKLCSPSK